MQACYLDFHNDLVKIMINAFKNISIKHRFEICSLAANRTRIQGFGDPYTIHCTTRPWAFRISDIRFTISVISLNLSSSQKSETIQILDFGFTISFRSLKLSSFQKSEIIYPKSFYQSRCISRKYFYGNGEQYYTKKFSYCYQTGRA